MDGSRLARGRLRRSSVLCIGVVLLGSLVSVLGRRGIPVAVGASSFDGGLFVRGATHLAQGDWLGPFDQLTLAKGPAYPAFIAVTHALAVPLKIGEQLTWLLAAGSTAGAVWLVTRRRWLAATAYLVLALSPDGFGWVNAGDVRDGWYASLSLLFLSALFLSVYGALSRVRLLWVSLAALLSGVTGGVFWLCREEGPWILPAVAVIALGLPLGCLLVRWYGAGEGRSSGRRIGRQASRTGVALVIVGAAFAAPIAVVMVENRDHYGTMLTNDLTNGAFARAYADWGRVHAGGAEPTVPVTHGQREAVYRVSSAARLLQPTLEAPNNVWRRLSCRYPASRKYGCDILGAFTVWAIRDAAAVAGQFRSAPDAQRFFTTLSQQIDTACSDHRLTCSARLPTFLQSLQQVRAGAALRSFGATAWSSAWSPAYTALPYVAYPTPQRARDAARAVIKPIAATSQAEEEELRRFQARDWPYRALADLYRWLLPALVVLGVVGAAAAAYRPRSFGQRPLVILCAALMVGVVGRLAVFTVVVLTQFDASGGRYQLPTRALMLAFGVVGSAMLVERFLSRTTQDSTHKVANSGGRAKAGFDGATTEPLEAVRRAP
jgi:hypothetical protein